MGNLLFFVVMNKFLTIFFYIFCFLKQYIQNDSFLSPRSLSQNLAAAARFSRKG